MIPLYAIYYILFFIVIVAVIAVFIYDRLKMLSCPDCGRRMTEGPQRYIYRGHDFGWFAAVKCEHCDIVYFREESLERIQEKAKKLGLWGKEQPGNL